mmetsp:Transcript_6019/g.21976  ORF Transcript_6019/g.21976 Transcript_6019/m.21976 type:complete len:249 (-) Transcript_6019:3225-3971(-)
MSNLGDTTTFKSFVEREAAAEKAAADGGGVAGAPPTTSSTADEKGPVSKKKKTLTRSITMDRLSTYVNVLKREKAANGAVPTVEVKCDFSYTLRLPKKTVERKIVTVPEAFAAVAMAPFKAIAAKAGARLAKKNDDDDDDDGLVAPASAPRRARWRRDRGDDRAGRGEDARERASAPATGAEATRALERARVLLGASGRRRRDAREESARDRERARAGAATRGRDRGAERARRVRQPRHHAREATSEG